MLSPTKKTNIESSNSPSNDISDLKNCHTHVTSIIQQIQQNYSGCQQTIKKLKQEIGDIQGKLKMQESQGMEGSDANKEKTAIKAVRGELLKNCKQRVDIASSINIKVLKKIQIEDKKSKANQIFKWILIAFYNEPENKYFWPNFQEEALKKDKGLDLIERLGKVSVMNLTEDQRIKTAEFLNKFNEYINAPEIKQIKEEIEKIHKIAELFHQADKYAMEMKEKQKSMEKEKEACMDKDEELFRCKAKLIALNDRLAINEKYSKLLMSSQQQLSGKIALYEQMWRKCSKTLPAAH